MQRGDAGIWKYRGKLKKKNSGFRGEFVGRTMDSIIGVPFDRITPKIVIPAKPSPPQISRCLQRGFPHLRPANRLTPHLPPASQHPPVPGPLGTGNKYPWSLSTRRTSRTFERNRTVFDGVLVVAFEQPAIATAERSRPSCRRISSCRSRRGRPGGWEQSSFPKEKGRYAEQSCHRSL